MCEPSKTHTHTKRGRRLGLLAAGSSVNFFARITAHSCVKFKKELLVVHLPLSLGGKSPFSSVRMLVNMRNNEVISTPPFFFVNFDPFPKM